MSKGSAHKQSLKINCKIWGNCSALQITLRLFFRMLLAGKYSKKFSKEVQIDQAKDITV